MYKHFLPKFRRLRALKTISLSRENRKPPWSRSDTISTVAVVISVFAATIAIFAELRVHQSNRRVAEAVAVAVSDRLRITAEQFEWSGKFIQGFNNYAKQHPQEIGHTDLLMLEVISNIELQTLSISPEQLTSVAHADADAATKLANCSQRHSAMQSDLKKFVGARPGELSDGQRSEVHVLPLRMRELSQACDASLNALVVLMPELLSIMGIHWGTIGERMNAQAAAKKEIADGTDAKLHISRGKSVANSQHVTYQQN